MEPELWAKVLPETNAHRRQLIDQVTLPPTCNPRLADTLGGKKRHVFYDVLYDYTTYYTGVLSASLPLLAQEDP
eukprot:4593803-Pyramimonas_sp.AAC.2